MIGNLEYLGSLGESYPQEFDGTLDCISLAVTCAFNRHGTLLAVGCNDGRIVIYDFVTRGIAKIILAHVHPVSNLCWSRDGYQLISASDKDVCVWDVLSSTRKYKLCFPSVILKVQFNPRNMSRILACPMKILPIVVEIEGNTRMIPVGESCKLQYIATYDRRGQFIFSGNVKGKILIINSETLIIVASFQISVAAPNPVGVKCIEFARRGGSFLVIGSDKTIRIYDVNKAMTCGLNGMIEPQQKIHDMVSRCAWKKGCFSGDGDYVCGGSGKEHALYIWEKNTKNLMKILQGNKGELLQDMVWHPIRPVIASISSGIVSIWTPTKIDNWSAFIPDFTELDENIYYEESESEFDLIDEDKSIDLSNEVGNCEDDEIDVITVQPIAALCSSDEEGGEDNALHILTIVPQEFETFDESINNPTG